MDIAQGGRDLTSETPVSDDFLRRAVNGADPNALRVALCQETGDPEVLPFEHYAEFQTTGHLSRFSKLNIVERDRPALKDSRGRNVYVSTAGCSR